MALYNLEMEATSDRNIFAVITKIKAQLVAKNAYLNDQFKNAMATIKRLAEIW